MKRAVISIGFYISVGFCHPDFKLDIPKKNISQIPRYNETCDSLENAKLCQDRCMNDGQLCAENCNLECNVCQRDFFLCIDGKDYE